MMTPQEVSEATFAKAVMGGYNMAAVDEFLDKLTEDYSALYKENTALKAKMKVLVERMDEYRQMEDSLRGTLLAAQRMADQIVKEAGEKRDTVLAETERLKKTLVTEAEQAANARKEELRQEIAVQERLQRETSARTDRLVEAEKLRLNQAKAATADFVEASKVLCRSQLAMLERLPEIQVEPVAVPEPEFTAPVPEAVQEEEPVAAEPEEVYEEPVEEEELPEEELEETAQEDSDDDVLAAIAELSAEPVFGKEPMADEDEVLSLWKDEPVKDLDSTRIIKLDQLQFGRNYFNED